MVANLKGIANKWLSMEEIDFSMIAYADLTDMLKEKFINKAERQQDVLDFKRRRLYQTEDVHSYSIHLQVLFNTAYPDMTEDLLLIDTFQAGLPYKIKWVLARK